MPLNQQESGRMLYSQGADGDDPHPKWLHDRQVLMEASGAAETDEEVLAIGEQIDAIDARIFSIPATTVAGIHAQLCALCLISDPADQTYNALCQVRDHMDALNRTKCT